MKFGLVRDCFLYGTSMLLFGKSSQSLVE